MQNYEHKKLIEHITEMDRPPDDHSAYAAWLAANAHLELLRQNADEDELIVYALGKHTFIHAVAVKENTLDPVDADDLLRWSGNPFSACSASYAWGGGRDDVWIERSAPVVGSKILCASSPLIFGRSIDRLPGQSISYFEVSQEYAHMNDIHHYTEHRAYCRFDKHGDLEKVVTITHDGRGASLVTFKRSLLEKYLAASDSALVRMFDFQLVRDKQIRSWPDTPENVFVQNPIFYRQKIDPGKAAYTRGVQIILPARPKAAIFSAIKKGHGEDDRYVDFLAHDFRNDVVTSISTDPQATTNYFQADSNSLPYETSPAFFKSEVLVKYKNDTDKYAIEERNIYCRGAWMLRGYDVNKAGQIHVYICDFQNLPYEEQLYWKSFNEHPKSGISERAMRNDFCGQWFYYTDPLQRIKNILEDWKKSNTTWWKLRDPVLVRRVAVPRTDSLDEWAREFKNLSMLVIEGFDNKVIHHRLKEMKLQWESDEKSLVLLERILSGSPANGSERKLNGLRLVQRIRSKIDAHARGGEASGIADRAIREHGSYSTHFEAVCLQIESELKSIEHAFNVVLEEQTETTS